MIKIIIGILMLCIIVVAHELGHMLVAKAFHIKVEEFWVGFGPKLFGFEKGGTKYCFRIIPLGGACVFEDPEIEGGDDSKTEGSADGNPANMNETSDKNAGSNTDNAAGTINNDADSTAKPQKKQLHYNEASVWARIATLFAGPLFNFILAFLMGLVVFYYSYIPSTLITDVTDGSPAQEAGLMAGDEIVKINSSRVYLYPEVSIAIQSGVGKPLSVVYKRGDKQYKTQIIPEMNDEYGCYMIGVSFGGGEEPQVTPLSVISGSYKYVRYMIKSTYASFGMLLSGKASVRDMSGAVGVVSVVSDEYDAAAAISHLAVVVSMLNLAVLISANLGVVNLFPFPALDGGKLVLAFYEVITRKKINEKVEGIINMIGMILLMMLLLFTMFNDITKLFGM